jgi:hypothetical protein
MSGKDFSKVPSKRKRGMRGQDGSVVRTTSVIKHSSAVHVRSRARRPDPTHVSPVELVVLGVFDDVPEQTAPRRFVAHDYDPLFDDFVPLDLGQGDITSLDFGPLEQVVREVMTIEEWRKYDV